MNMMIITLKYDDDHHQSGQTHEHDEDHDENNDSKGIDDDHHQSGQTHGLHQRR